MGNEEKTVYLIIQVIYVEIFFMLKENKIFNYMDWFNITLSFKF